MSVTRASVVPSSLRIFAPSFSVPGGRLYIGLGPIAVLEMENMSRAGYEAILAKIDELVIAPKKPYVMITDTRGITEIPGADVRKLVAAWMEKNASGHTSLGSATIVKSAVMRGALTALYWLFEPPTAQYVASDWQDAHAWGVSKLDEAGVTLFPSVRGATKQPY